MLVEFLAMMGISPLAMKDCILYIGIIGCLLFAVSVPLAMAYWSNFEIKISVICIIMAIVGLACMGPHMAPNTEIQINALRANITTDAYSFSTSTIQPIVSLKDSSSYSSSGNGRFFLGSGSFTTNGQTTTQHVFYKTVGDGYQLDRLNSDGVIVKEDNQTSPNIEWVYRHTVSEKKEYLDNNETSGGIDRVSLYATYIHVPKGTVIQDYKLDSEV